MGAAGGSRALAVALAVISALAPSVAAAPAGVELGPLQRVQTPRDALCPFESEPEVTSTSAGTWVGYNDGTGCPLVAADLRLTGVQLVRRDGKRVYVDLPRRSPRDYWSGDPDLVPDPAGGGGVLLSSLYSTADGLDLAVARIRPDGRAEHLPPPTAGGSNDKEFLAADLSPRSRYRGRVYLVWDDFTEGGVTVRAFDGRRWLDPVRLGAIAGQPDVAVSDAGDVAVAWSTAGGVSARVSRDGGASFGEEAIVLRGAGPGRDDPSCPLRPTIAQRQRATKSPRVAWDRGGRLHVVAALHPDPLVGVASGTVGAGTGGRGVVLHAVSASRGADWTRPQAVAVVDAEAVQWAPAVAALPRGGVAVSWLQMADATTYDALLAVLPARGTRFGPPVVLSEGRAPLPPAQEGVGFANCYGVGDYTGLAPTPEGAVAVWPTTVGVETAFSDSDIAVRSVRVR